MLAHAGSFLAPLGIFFCRLSRSVGRREACIILQQELYPEVGDVRRVGFYSCELVKCIEVPTRTHGETGLMGKTSWFLSRSRTVSGC